MKVSELKIFFINLNSHYFVINVLILEKSNLLSFLKINNVTIGVNVAKIKDQNNSAVDIQIGKVSA